MEQACGDQVFARVVEVNGLPREIVIDKSAANTEGIKDTKRMLNWFKCPILFELVRNKYLNNLVEQDHRFIKRRARPHELQVSSVNHHQDRADRHDLQREVQTGASPISTVLSDCHLKPRQSSRPCVSTPNLRQNRSAISGTEDAVPKNRLSKHPAREAHHGERPRSPNRRRIRIAFMNRFNALNPSRGLPHARS